MDERLRKSQAQEKRVAKMHRSGSRNAGSGNGWRRKHDVRWPGVLWEMKRTDNDKTITLKLEDLQSVHKISAEEGRIPIMHLETKHRRYVMFEEDDAIELMEDAGRL